MTNETHFGYTVVILNNFLFQITVFLGGKSRKTTIVSSLKLLWIDKKPEFYINHYSIVCQKDFARNRVNFWKKTNFFLCVFNLRTFYVYFRSRHVYRFPTKMKLFSWKRAFLLFATTVFTLYVIHSYFFGQSSSHSSLRYVFFHLFVVICLVLLHQQNHSYPGLNESCPGYIIFCP